MNGRICTLGLAVFFTALLGVLIGPALQRPEPAFARTASSSDDVVVITSRAMGGTRDVVWIIDTRGERLLVYELREEHLSLAAARNIHWDLLIPNEMSRAGQQTPSVNKVRKDTEAIPDAIPSRTRKILAAAGRSHADERDVLYLLDTKSLRQAIYSYHNGQLKVVAARNIRYDLRLDEWPEGKQDPGVEAIRKLVEGERSETAGPKGM